MSFPRAAIKRFNEAADSTIPPPGAYDPKFATDVAVSSTLKGSNGFDKWGRPSPSTNNNNGFVGTSFAAGSPLGATGVIPLRARSSSHGPSADVNELVNRSRSRFAFNAPAAVGSGIKSRDTSLARLSRRRSSTTGIMAGSPESRMMTNMIRRRSNTRVINKSYSKPRILKGRSPIRTGSGIRRAPSTTCTYSACLPQQAFAEILKDTLKAEGVWNTMMARSPEKCYADAEQQIMDMELEPGEVIVQQPPLQPQSVASRPPRCDSSIRSGNGGDMGIGTSSANIFDEIQQLAESLQNELSDYKLKLGKERIRSQELEAKKLELEFINHSFKRQLEKYENVKESWEVGELTNRSKVDDLAREKDILDAKLEDLQTKLTSTEESEFNLQEKVSRLEEEKLQWQEEKMEFEMSVESLQKMLKEEEIKRGEVEEKIRELESQMDTCYHTCESRMADTENMKETYEVKIQELTEQIDELQKKMEGMKRELDTQKTLMELMKSEQEQKNKDNLKKEDDGGDKHKSHHNLDNYIS